MQDRTDSDREQIVDMIVALRDEAVAKARDKWDREAAEDAEGREALETAARKWPHRWNPDSARFGKWDAVIHEAGLLPRERHLQTFYRDAATGAWVGRKDGLILFFDWASYEFLTLRPAIDAGQVVPTRAETSAYLEGLASKAQTDADYEDSMKRVFEIMARRPNL